MDDLYEKIIKTCRLYRQGRIDLREDEIEMESTDRECYQTQDMEPSLILMGLDPLKFSRAMQCNACGTFFRANRLVLDKNVECPFCWGIGTSREQK